LLSILIHQPERHSGSHLDVRRAPNLRLKFSWANAEWLAPVAGPTSYHSSPSFIKMISNAAMHSARGAREKNLTFCEAFGCGHVFGL
jgi:hypothetical protein